jgi:alpha-L-fucosidase 2
MKLNINRRQFGKFLSGAISFVSLGSMLEHVFASDPQKALASTISRGIHDVEPATNWEDAFLSGNGEYGIMVYGNPLTETVIFNSHKFEQPNGTLHLKPPVIANLLPQVRSHLLAGNYTAAQNGFANGWPLYWTQPAHPGYEMQLTISSKGSMRQYKRVTNFETGEITVQWIDDLGEWSRSCFVSRADHVVVQQLRAPSQGKLNLSIKLNGNLPNLPLTINFTNTLSTDAHGHTMFNLRGQYSSDATQGGYEGVTWVVRDGGSQNISGTTLTISNANLVLLLTKLDRYADVTQWNNLTLQNKLVTLSPNYNVLLRRHVNIHQAIYNRMTIDLNGSPSDRALSTTALLNMQVSNPTKLNNTLLEQMFYAGRYHFISSTGYFPPRLQGIWGGSWITNWSNDFTTDANLNLQIAGMNISNMPEMTRAYSNLILKQIGDWKTNATNIYGMRGILGPLRTDGMDGYQYHFDSGAFPAEMWTASADWLLYPLYEHYMVTGDAAFLKDSLWPCVQQLAYFYEDFLTETDANGHVVFLPSFSPENSPSNTSCMGTINATMDVAAGKHALQMAIATAKILKVEQGAGHGIARWTALLHKIPPYRVNSDGALAEWIWPSLNDNYHHRHVSHLYPVWPLHDITPDNNPTLAQAAAKALTLRVNPEQAAHGYLHCALAWTRLKDGRQVAARLLDILANKFVFRSLMTSHYPNYNVYNADSAHTLPAIIIEMLTDSQPATPSQLGITEFLPALPPTITHGTITGVTGRNRVTINRLTWNIASGKVSATLTSAVTQRITLINRPGIRSITSRAPLAPSSLGSFARVLSLQAGVSTPVSITI